MRQRILITGASTGLGRGMALEFAARGRDLALCARRLDLLQALREEIAAHHPGVRVAIRALDVNDHARVFSVFGELRDELGGLDRIIVNAGITPEAGEAIVAAPVASPPTAPPPRRTSSPPWRSARPRSGSSAPPAPGTS